MPESELTSVVVFDLGDDSLLGLKPMTLEAAMAAWDEAVRGGC